MILHPPCAPPRSARLRSRREQAWPIGLNRWPKMTLVPAFANWPNITLLPKKPRLLIGLNHDRSDVTAVLPAAQGEGSGIAVEFLAVLPEMLAVRRVAAGVALPR